jgi:hypothetical protein
VASREIRTGAVQVGKLKGKAVFIKLGENAL